ncbi:MAG: ribulose-phosphate 3-epimerase [Lachnospiraceae bacterium]|nr:ribulose-phosphate 3-epimerase [Lachnospiraceae bacterium]
MFKLAPSILAADFAKLGEQIAAVEQAGAHELHIDVMDGLFVPSISFGMPVIESIRKVSNMFFDVHLMITEPIRYAEEFVKAGADGITVHAEACSDLKKTVDAIKAYGVKVGVSIKPETPISVLADVELDLDRVLIMTVNPGFGGQKLISECIEKVKDLAKHREKISATFDIQVDGGIGLANVKTVAEAGAEVFVAGTAVFRGDIMQNVQAFKEAVGVAD